MCDEMIFYFQFPHSPVEMNTIPKDSQELNKGIIEDLREKKKIMIFKQIKSNRITLHGRCDDDLSRDTYVLRTSGWESFI